MDEKDRPTCPHCNTPMIRIKYTGFYDSAIYWGCDCKEFPDYDKEIQGEYA